MFSPCLVPLQISQARIGSYGGWVGNCSGHHRGSHNSLGRIVGWVGNHCLARRFVLPRDSCLPVLHEFQPTIPPNLAAASVQAKGDGTSRKTERGNGEDRGRSRSHAPAWERIIHMGRVEGDDLGCCSRSHAGAWERIPGRSGVPSSADLLLFFFSHSFARMRFRTRLRRTRFLDTGRGSVLQAFPRWSVGTSQTREREISFRHPAIASAPPGRAGRSNPRGPTTERPFQPSGLRPRA